MTPSKDLPPSVLRTALLGAAPVAGWLLHDAAIFVSYGWPSEALGLLPVSLLCLAVGAGVGVFLRGRTWAALALLLVAAIWWVATRTGLLPGVGAVRHLPAAVFLLALAGVGARAIGARSYLGAARLGVFLGAAACLLATSRTQRIESVSFVLVGSLGVWCLAASLPRLRSRALLVDGLLFLPLLWFVQRANTFLELPRTDLPANGRGMARAGAPNLLLIVLDTLRADHVSGYGYEFPTTPRLDAFSRERAVTYRNATSACSWTLPSHGSLFTGLLPSEHGITHPRTQAQVEALLGRGFTAHPLRAGVTTIAETLRAAGYRTGAVISNASTLRVEYGVARGFEHFDARRANFVRGYISLAQMLGAPIAIGHRPYRDATTITDLALDWLDAEHSEAPFFLTLNYMEAHLPYLPPAPYAQLFGEEQPADPLHPEEALLSLLYDREIRYLDDEIGRLLDGLDARGLGSTTAVVITGDHGEGFGEHGLWKHDWSLYEELVHVPLWVATPGGEGAGSVIEDRITGPKVHDRMLALCGLPVKERVDTGEAMRPFAEWYTLETIPLHADASWTKAELDRNLVGWFEGNRKWLVGSNGHVEVFDLDTDPGEAHPLELTGTMRETALAKAHAWWEAHPAPARAFEEEMADSEVDEDVLNRLRGLGYVGEEK